MSAYDFSNAARPLNQEVGKDKVYINVLYNLPCKFDACVSETECEAGTLLVRTPGVNRNDDDDDDCYYDTYTINGKRNAQTRNKCGYTFVNK